MDKVFFFCFSQALCYIISMRTFGFYFKEILSIKIKMANIFFHFLLLKAQAASGQFRMCDRSNSSGKNKP